MCEVRQGYRHDTTGTITQLVDRYEVGNHEIRQLLIDYLRLPIHLKADREGMKKYSPPRITACG